MLLDDTTTLLNQKYQRTVLFLQSVLLPLNRSTNLYPSVKKQNVKKRPVFHFIVSSMAIQNIPGHGLKIYLDLGSFNPVHLLHLAKKIWSIWSILHARYSPSCPSVSRYLVHLTHKAYNIKSIQSICHTIHVYLVHLPYRILSR